MKNNKKAFTLAELLVVVAIIAVLVAISIPIFSAQLEKAKEATDTANIRARYAELMTAVLLDETASVSSVTLTQGENGWQNTTNKDSLEKAGMVLSGTPAKNGSASFSYSSGVVTVTFE